MTGQPELTPSGAYKVQLDDSTLPTQYSERDFWYVVYANDVFDVTIVYDENTLPGGYVAKEFANRCGQITTNSEILEEKLTARIEVNNLDTATFVGFDFYPAEGQSYER